MGDRMRPIPFEQMLHWISGEYRNQQSVFGIPESCFFRKENHESIRIFDETCDTPVGPAAGPHTQLAQNIAAAYLVGGRFFELKTVQKLDSLEFEKPCIDARDEGYNTEWSQELSLEQAFDEYVKAWILLHFMEALFNMRPTGRRSFVFNTSVGYDLKGIKTEGMERFITGLYDASGRSVFKRHLEELAHFIRSTDFSEFMGMGGKVQVSDSILSGISPHIVESVTLSTMHGCPPEEIEAISRYLMEEKRLHTFVKLNPTLLGYERVRDILDALGFDYIELKESAFAGDLQYDDAVGMLERLSGFAAECGRHFGIKLSNTLGTVNTPGILPGDEMYMSGRALFPLTISLAYKLSREFDGALPVSFSGGVSQMNIDRIFDTGIRPITVVTDLLKPGGYLRMAEMARILEPLIEGRGESSRIDVEKLGRAADEALKKDCYRKGWRGTETVRVEQKLPLTDCYTAPCVLACPIQQDIPEYITLAGAGKYDRALELIYLKNPLPNITGYICDHQCMYNCTRLDYEGPVCIREVKRIAALYGENAYSTISRGSGKQPGTKIAVIGAGPAGLAASYFLTRTGFRVTVFEKQDSPGGVIAHVMPNFRIPAAAVERDISAIRAMGVDFQFNVSEEFSIREIKDEGYKYVFIGTGAEVSRKLQLTGENENVYDALDFLRAFNTDPGTLDPGRSVAVVGGGNTAMDSARSALRLGGVEEVTIIYRRTEDEMPADREEFDSALKEGVRFMPLMLPESFSKSGILKCRKMTLGDSDSSGRKRPVPTDEIEELAFDSVISAIGEYTDLGILAAGGLKLNKRGLLNIDSATLETDIENVFIGGDAFRGPSTVVESIADARKAAEAIARKEIKGWKMLDEDFEQGFERKGLDEGFDRDLIRKEQDEDFEQGPVRMKQASEIFSKKGRLVFPKKQEDDKLIAENEAGRCLECNIICNKCVDVCPNRANVAIMVDREEGFKDAWQIIHLDALCNECGNCATFCPYDGLPYRDKLTLFNQKDDFENSENDGFVVTGSAGSRSVTLRLNGSLRSLNTGRSGELFFTDSQILKGNGSGNMREAGALINTVLRDHSYLIQAAMSQ